MKPKYLAKVVAFLVVSLLVSYWLVRKLTFNAASTVMPSDTDFSLNPSTDKRFFDNVETNDETTAYRTDFTPKTDATESKLEYIKWREKLRNQMRKDSKVSVADVASNPEFTCLRPDPPKINYHLCIFDLKRDWYISASVMKTGQWEGDLSAAILQALKVHPGSNFIDLGAYIGTHTVFVAHKGYQVVSVEPYEDNLFLLNRSLQLNHMNNVRVIPKCLSNKSELETFLKFGNNPGGAKIITQPDHLQRATSQLSCITLNQLANEIPFKSAVMKVDIEESEIRVFQEGSADSFFNRLEIFAIFMEWGSMPKLKDTRGESDVAKMIQFFWARHFEPFVITSNRLRSLSTDPWHNWPWDIVWLKYGKKNKFFTQAHI